MRARAHVSTPGGFSRTRRPLVALGLVALTIPSVVAGAVIDGVSVREVPLDEATTPGEHAHAAIAGVEARYEDAYFSKGHSIHEMKGTGYHPWSRLRHFYEQRQDHEGRLDPGLRWERYQEVRARTLREGQVLRTASWTSLGPEPFDDGVAGRMISLAFDPTDADVMYAGSSAAGLWRSTDGAGTWEPMTDELPSLRISSVAVDPTDRDRILIGTGTGYFTTIMLDPGVGVLVSTNRGVTWDLTSFSVPFDPNGVSTYALAWDTLTPERVYLAATNGLWRSTDRGDTWTQVLVGEATDVDVHPTNPGEAFASMDRNGVYRTTNGGDTWTRVSGGLPPASNHGRGSLSICESAPATIYASIANPTTFALEGLYRTDDGGGTWTELTSVPDYLCNPGVTTGCPGWLFNTLAVAPHDPDLVLVGGVRLYRSSNGGASWTWHDYLSNGLGFDNEGLAYVDDWAIRWHPDDPSRVFVLNDGGVFESTNAGLWWEKRNTGLVTGLFYTVAVDPRDVDHVAGGTQDHGAAAVDHGEGSTVWSKWTTGDGGPMNIDHTDGQIVYATLQFGNHIKSFNGGLAMVLPFYQINGGILEAGPFIAATVMDPTDPETLYYASTARIYKTVNGGEPWTTAAVIPNVRTLAVDHVDPDLVYAHAYDGSTWQLHRSTTGGGSWIQITDPSIPSWRVTDLHTVPGVPDVVYATRNSAFAGNDHVKVSTNAGVTWTDITGDLPDVPTHAIAVSPHEPDHLYLATDLGVFFSETGGGIWQEWNDGLPLVVVNDIAYHADTRTLTIGTEGRGVWRSPAVDASVSVPSTSTPPYRVAAPHPNPARGHTSVSVSLDHATEVHGAIYDVLGQRVATLPAHTLGAGAHDLRWDGRNRNGDPVGAGTYFIRIEADGLAMSRRVQIVR